MSLNLPSPAVACAENIALLYLLHSVPNSPLSNDHTVSSVPQNGYILSFERERHLVYTLGFLCNTGDDTNHIPAVCIRQNTDKSKLDVLIAVNRVDQNDGNQSLADLEQGLEHIFALLKRLSNGYNAGIEKDVLQAIISMCTDRILIRMRFMSSKNRARQPFKSLLQDVMNSLSQVKAKSLKLKISLVLTEAKIVLKLIDAWIGHQVPSRLLDLVKGVSQLWQVGDFDALMDAIPKHLMQPSAKNNFVNMISKISRYPQAARFLYRTAKKFSIVQSMRAIRVEMPPNAFNTPSLENYNIALPSTILRVKESKKQWDLGYISQLLGITVAQMKTQFADQVKKTVEKSKIHAEVQLLFYCEADDTTTALIPRVICSSKDACFLCNALIAVHGKKHMPRSHGRLYPAWRLPSIPQSVNALERLNYVLESHIRQSVKTMLDKKQRISYPEPNESTLLPLPLSTSTVLLNLNEDIIRNNPYELNSNAATQDTANRLISLENLTNAENILQKPRTSCTEDIVNVPNPQSSNFFHYINDNAELLIDDMQLHKIEANSGAHRYHDGKIEIFIEYSTHLKPLAEGNANKLEYRIRWLQAEEAKSLQTRESDSIIDAESLDCQESLILDTNAKESIFLSGGGSMLQFCINHK